MKLLLKPNSNKKPKKFSNGPKRKELFTTPSSASPDQEASHKNNKPSSISTISSAKAPWIPKETAFSTLLLSWKEKQTDPASPQEDSDKPAEPEPTPFGTSNLTSYSETEIKLFTFPHFWFLTSDTPWTTRLYSEPVRVSSARASRAFWKSSVFKTAELLWLWASSKNSSPSQEKLTSRELILEQPAELWSDNSQPSTNNSQIIITEKFLTKLKTSWRKSKTNSWN